MEGSSQEGPWGRTEGVAVGWGRTPASADGAVMGGGVQVTGAARACEH